MNEIDNTEMYYACMEAARNGAEDAYFNARPSSDTPLARQTFRGGFERAYKLLWKPDSEGEKHGM